MNKYQMPTLTDDEMRSRLALPEGPLRLIIDTDTHNEIDDQFALAWALLSQDRLEIEGVLAEPYSFAHHQAPMLEAYQLITSGQSLPEHLMGYNTWVDNLIKANVDPETIPFVSPAEGVALSYQEILTVFDKVGADASDLVYQGSPDYLTTLDNPIQSAATDHLIKRALADDDRPLYVVAIGCITNVASAILLEPEIIKKIVVVWTSAYPSTTNLWNGASLNLVQDPLASQFIFDCGVPHVYLPGFHVGAQLSVSLPEMEAWVKGKGAMGDYLYHLYTHNPIYAQRGITDHFARTWIIWDVINIAWLLNPDWVSSQLVRSPILGDDLYWQHDDQRHWMREAHGINRDAIFRDLFLKLEKSAM
ncbi:MAG: nucleoside hydrolase [Chloroflexota bacterium]